MINGMLGETISSKSDLKQGDALKHPLGVDGFFPVLQYADDTLLLLQGDVQQAQVIKRVLHVFSGFTGLRINFSKSTFVPICMDQATCQEVAPIFQCPVSSFQCIYLGLPLSTLKITHGLLLPVISKVDKRLSGRLATFLSWGAAYFD